MMHVQPYTDSLKKTWNDFVDHSSNATFLLNRNYMDYHSNRFNDQSLLVYQNKKLVGLFPANVKKTTVYSHGGLTYGGLIVQEPSLFTTLACFYAITHHYHKQGIGQIQYKPVPSFFHSKIYLQDYYALFLLNARLTAMNTGFVCTPDSPISTRRRRMISKAKQYALSVRKSSNCTLFWERILVPHLTTKFKTSPVHSLDEIEHLRSHFPQQIMQYDVFYKNAIVAGVTIFYDRHVAHSQYIASNDIGRNTGALDYLF